jgi:hypothetical protein
MTERLKSTVQGVLTALDLLHTAAGEAAVLAALDQANAAVDDLEQDLTAEALHVVLNEIGQCHRVGLENSPQLRVALKAMTVALQIDPRLQ